jgi:hypothetical protein
VLSPNICSEFLADLRLVYCDQTFERGKNGACTSKIGVSGQSVACVGRIFGQF